MTLRCCVSRATWYHTSSAIIFDISPSQLRVAGVKVIVRSYRIAEIIGDIVG